jgi:histidyl-tRNA synthetase
MIAALESLGKLPAADGFAGTAIACVNAEHGGLYQALATQFRRAGIPCEVFLEASDEKQIVKQFVLAEKKGLRRLVIPGANPLKDPVTLRDLAARKNTEGLSVDETVKIIKNVDINNGG